MIDREEEAKTLAYNILNRFPEDILQILVDGKVVGIIYIQDKKQESFWISTLEIANEKLRQRELSL